MMELVTALKSTNFRLESELLEGLQAVRTRDGISVSEQVRRAIASWLKQKGVTIKADRKRVVARKRP